MGKGKDDDRHASQKAFLPSDLGSEPPSPLTEAESLCRERLDPRREHTAYVEWLRAWVEREGPFLGQEPIDSRRHSRYDQGVNQSKETTMEATLEAPKVEKAKASKKKAAKKAAKKASKPKTKAKAKKAAKPKAKQKHAPRGERQDVPCCVNYARRLLKAIDARAKKAKVSRSRFMQTVLAKAVGYKIAS